MKTKTPNIPQEYILKSCFNAFSIEPTAIILRGSNSYGIKNTIYNTDYDIMAIVNNNPRRDHKFEKDETLIDLTIITNENLEKLLIEIHTDSVERISIMDLGYSVIKGSQKLTQIEESMRETVIKDFERYASSCVEGKIEAKLSEISLYPLMIDLYRLPEIHVSAEKFLNWQGLSKAIEENISLYKKAAESLGYKTTDNTISFETKKTDCPQIPKIEKEYTRVFPEIYHYGQPKQETDESNINLIFFHEASRHFKKQGKTYHYFSKIKDLLYGEKIL